MPVAMSSGFSPRPRISYANSAPTGASSEAEYVEIALTRPVDPEVLRAALDQALPEGLDVVAAVVVGTPEFATRLEASRWQIEFPGLDVQSLADAVDRLWAAPEAMVERTMKSGRRRFDARAALSHAEVTSDGCAILTVVVRHGTPSVRPDDVVMALHATADLVPPEPPRFTRLAQGPLDEQSGAISDPLEMDRAAHRPT
jgi:radical SAM-linked protein